MRPHYVLRDLEDAVPGMILSGPILGSDGQTLIAGGAELTETMLAMLRARGLLRVSVLDTEPSEGNVDDERQHLRERISKLFRNCGDQPASSELMHSVLKYRLGEGA